MITTDQPLRAPEEMLTNVEFRQGLGRSVVKLGKIWGRSWGSVNPASFSVRSGARVSMPGMMTTITNVGINDEIAEALAKKVGPWFAVRLLSAFLTGIQPICVWRGAG